MAFISFLHCLLVCFQVTVSLLINYKGKSNQKPQNSSLKHFSICVPTLAISDCVTACHSAMLCYSLVCSFIPLVFLSCLCLVTLYHFQPHSLRIPFLFHLALVHTSLTLLLFPQCFHTLSPFKPFVLHFFFVLHFTLALSHMFNFLYFITEFLGVYLQCCLAGIRAASLVFL